MNKRVTIIACLILLAAVNTAWFVALQMSKPKEFVPSWHRHMTVKVEELLMDGLPGPPGRHKLYQVTFDGKTYYLMTQAFLSPKQSFEADVSETSPRMLLDQAQRLMIDEPEDWRSKWGNVPQPDDKPSGRETVKLQSITDRDDYPRFRLLLKNYVSQNSDGRATLYISRYNADDATSQVNVYWAENKQMLTLPVVVTDDAIRKPSLVVRSLQIPGDVSENRGGSNYLVSPDWIQEKIFEAVVNGSQLVFPGKEKAAGK